MGPLNPPGFPVGRRSPHPQAEDEQNTSETCLPLRFKSNFCICNLVTQRLSVPLLSRALQPSGLSSLFLFSPCIHPHHLLSDSTFESQLLRPFSQEAFPAPLGWVRGFLSCSYLHANISHSKVVIALCISFLHLKGRDISVLLCDQLPGQCHTRVGA